MSLDEFEEHARELSSWIAGYLRQVRDYPVLPDVQPGFLALPGSAPEQGEPFDRIFSDFVSLILPGVTHWNHPRFFAYFSVSASPAGILGEMLAAALNLNGMLWKSSPSLTELELKVTDWLRQWMGLPDGWMGLIYDTASVSTLHALAAAREVADPECREEGFRRGLVVYCSAQAHSSVDKAAIALGFGRHYIRHIPVDSEFRMIPSELARAIREDREAGLRPCAAVATVGTTSTTSVDPVRAIAEVCRDEGVWLHVDAAYGGACALVEDTRRYLDGADLADSLVVNPHKWFFTPIDCSVLFVRTPDTLRRAFSLVPEYLKTAEDDAVNLMDYGVPLGRRFRALKLWFVMRSFGREGIAARIRNHLEWAGWFAERVEGDPRFALAAPVPMSLVCFRLKSSDRENEELLEWINRSGKAFLSHTRLNGHFVLRLAIGNLQTSFSDIEETWRLVQEGAGSLKPS